MNGVMQLTVKLIILSPARMRSGDKVEAVL